MICRLFYNKSDKRYVNKTLEAVTRVIHDTTVSEFNVEFIDDSSYTNPILKLATDSHALTANYLELVDFHRYYYITNIVVSQGYLILYCHVDVLMSFKDEIMNEDVILDRQETEFDLYQEDREYHLSDRVNVRTIPFSQGFSKGGCNYILHVCGKTTSSPESEEV